jgi:hypothetical protein
LGEGVGLGVGVGVRVRDWVGVWVGVRVRVGVGVGVRLGARLGARVGFRVGFRVGVGVGVRAARWRAVVGALCCHRKTRTPRPAAMPSRSAAMARGSEASACSKVVRGVKW